jgi:uncharacterized membrane protein YbaN (DUF454 family)
MPDQKSSSLRRWTYASIGVGCVALAAIGVILPGMPTVIFLIAACYLFARSIPRLEAALIGNRFFARYLDLMDGKQRLSLQAKWAIVACIWLSSSISCSLMYAYGLTSVWLILVVAVLNIAATYFILRR